MRTFSNSQSARSKRSQFQPATYSAADTFGLVGCSYSTGMELIKTNRFPLQPLRIGRTYRFRKSDVHAYLGMEEQEANVA